MGPRIGGCQFHPGNFILNRIGEKAGWFKTSSQNMIQLSNLPSIFKVWPGLSLAKSRWDPPKLVTHRSTYYFVRILYTFHNPVIYPTKIHTTLFCTYRVALLLLGRRNDWFLYISYSFMMPVIRRWTVLIDTGKRLYLTLTISGTRYLDILTMRAHQGRDSW